MWIDISYRHISERYCASLHPSSADEKPDAESDAAAGKLPSDEVIRAGLKGHLPDGARIELRGATLKEIFVANATSTGAPGAGHMRS